MLPTLKELMVLLVQGEFVEPSKDDHYTWDDLSGCAKCFNSAAGWSAVVDCEPNPATKVDSFYLAVQGADGNGIAWRFNKEGTQLIQINF